MVGNKAAKAEEYINGTASLVCSPDGGDRYLAKMGSVPNAGSFAIFETAGSQQTEKPCSKGKKGAPVTGRFLRVWHRREYVGQAQVDQHKKDIGLVREYGWEK